MRASLVALLLVALTFLRCTPAREKIPALPEMKPAESKIIIYQMMTRLFGNTNATNQPFGTLEENGVGKFNDITVSALNGIKELGVTHVWYTGVLEHALMTDYSAQGIPKDDPDVVKGLAGSPYSIKDYYDVNPDLAVNVKKRLNEFDQLVNRTHEAGLKVLIDFVPNHVARTYHSDAKPENAEDFGASDDQSKVFSPSNNFYYLPGESFQVPVDHYNRFRRFYSGMDGRFDETPAKATGDDLFTSKPKADSWFESIKLNYGVDYLNHQATHFDSIPDTWNKMRDILVYWTGHGVDGFRCDMVQKVPVEFWRWVIPQVKAVNPEIIFIAEIYIPSLYRDYLDRGRFDFLYDKVQLYDTLRLLISGKPLASDIRDIQESLKPNNRHMVHFMENHDEQRIASPLFAGAAAKGLPAMVVSATIDQGPVMIYFGQEVGEPGAGAEGFGDNDGRTTIYDYWGVPEHQKWMNQGAFDGGQLSDAQKSLRAAYSRILTTARDHEAIREGEYWDLTNHILANKGSSNRVVSFARGTQDEKLIIMASFNYQAEQVRILLTPELADQWDIKPAQKYGLKDLLGDTTTVTLSRDQGAAFLLPAYGSRIYQVIPAPN